MLVLEWLQEHYYPRSQLTQHGIKVWASCPIAIAMGAQLMSVVVEEQCVEYREPEASPQGILATVRHLKRQALDLVLTDAQSQ